jgi:hypothetical protein
MCLSIGAEKLGKILGLGEKIIGIISQWLVAV